MFLADKTISALLRRHYVFLTFRINEYAKTKDRERPGALAFMKSVRQSGTSAPFYVVLDSSRKPIGDAYKGPNRNIGYPEATWEIEGFTDLLRRTSSLKPEELSVVAEWLKKHARKRFIQ